MSVKKKYEKKKQVCKVTFVLKKEEARGAKSVRLVGDFNNWDTASTPMKNGKNGTFEVTVDLKPNQEYQFRYLLDESIWENDWSADKYVPSNFGSCENSVIVV